MKDRQPTQPGRVKLTPENGTAPFYAIMEMADEPTEIGTPPTKANLLQDETEHALFGNIADRTVNDAFANIAKELSVLRLKADDVAALSVTLKSTQGNPLANVQILGMFDEDGNTCATNASGVASGYVAEGNVTLSVSNYADIVDYSETFVAEAGRSYTRAMTVTTRNFLKLTISKNVKFSDNVQRVDVSLGGGGGGGGGGQGYSDFGGGAGGGGGDAIVQENVDFTTNTSYTAMIGAGGAGGDAADNGTSGGATTFMGLTATGGSYGRSSGGAGGAGNGTGGNGATWSASNGYTDAGNGVSGSVQVYTSMTDTALYGGGGGGGAYGSYRATNNGTGGSPNGADGGIASSTTSVGNGGSATAGTGGGGGGGSALQSGSGYSAKGGAGGSGMVAIRMHLNVA